MIKAIVFDCFGVLTVTDNWREFWGRLSPAQAEQAREKHRQYDRGSLTHDQFFGSISEITELSISDITLRLESENLKNSPLMGYIASLKPKYKIGLISNVASDWITTEFLTPAEQKLFDDMVLSYKEGLVKPDPRIFKLACQRLGIKPEEAVLIDDIKSYCDAAEAVGMKAVLYKNFAQMKRDLESILKAANFNN